MESTKTTNQIRWKNIKRGIAKCCYPKIFIDLDTMRKDRDSAAVEFHKQRDKNTTLSFQLSVLEKELITEKLRENKTKLEVYCEKNFKQVSKFAYKNKRKFGNFKYSVYPNELIQPDKYLVDKAITEIGIKAKYNFDNWAKKVGQYVDNKLLWTADSTTKGVPDYYSSPVESLLNPKQDCEDHSFLAASLEPEMGVAFGYCGKSGHAWNVFTVNGILYCMETNSTYDKNRNVKVFRYDTQTKYKIHWIFTKDFTFQCVGTPVNFGIKE